MGKLQAGQDENVLEIIEPLAGVNGASVNGHPAIHGTKKAGFSDPAFASNKTLPVHRWVPWIAGFSSDFVNDALRRHLPHPGVVLDPFAGVGTTLVEAVKAGHDAVGFEINPYAALASRVKATAGGLDTELLRVESLRFWEFYSERAESAYQPRTSVPPGFKTRAPFYSPAVLRKVLILQDFIETIEDAATRDVFRLTFAATMVSYSNYSYEPSLGRRVSSGKSEIHDFPVATAFIEKIAQIISDAGQLAPSASKRIEIFNASFFQWQNYLEPESVDLIITSPPYLNNYHYNRNTRPQLYWLGFAEQPADFRELEEANFGKYWQTVRDRARIDLNFSLPDGDLAQRLETIRGLGVERGIYGGKGWANYAASYFNDCACFVQAVKGVLRPGGTALVVIGNSILQGVQITTDRYLSQIAACCGLETVEIHMPRATRIGSSIIQSGVRVAKAKDSHRLYEAVVELRKPA